MSTTFMNSFKNGFGLGFVCFFAVHRRLLYFQNANMYFLNQRQMTNETANTFVTRGWYDDFAHKSDPNLPQNYLYSSKSRVQKVSV